MRQVYILILYFTYNTVNFICDPFRSIVGPFWLQFNSSVRLIDLISQQTTMSPSLNFEKLSIPIPHSKPSFISFASSFICFKETISPSLISSASRITLALAFLLIRPSVTLEPAINPILGILKTSWTIALPRTSSTYSGSSKPSRANVTSSTA